MLKLVYPACFYPNGDGYTIAVPDLPGCVTEGKNMAEAVEMATDAASGWILDSFESGESIPQATTDISDIQLDEPDGIINFIMLDVDSYAEKIGEKAVKKLHNSCTVKCRRRKKKHQFFGCGAVGFEKRAAYNRALMCA